jgi:hypothetical protein
LEAALRGVAVADEPKGPDEKSIEMRVAELEDKLAQMHITEDELKAFNKVAGMMGLAPRAPAAGPAAEAPGAGGQAAAAGPVSSGCILDCAVSGCLTECLIRQCTIVRACTIRNCTIVRACTNECFECGGGCAPGGGGFFGGGGFGGLGG